MSKFFIIFNSESQELSKTPKTLIDVQLVLLSHIFCIRQQYSDAKEVKKV